MFNWFQFITTGFIHIALHSLQNASQLTCYQPDVRALKQQLHDREEKNGKPKYKS